MLRRNGSTGWKAGKRFRRPGERKALDSKEECPGPAGGAGHVPDQVASPGPVWTVRRPANWSGAGSGSA